MHSKDSIPQWTKLAALPFHPLLPLGLLMSAALLGGCPDPDSADPQKPADPKSSPATDPASPTPLAEPAGEDRETRTMAQVHPIIQQMGEQGATPSNVTVEFSQPIVSRSGVAINTDTRLVIEPPVDGTLSFTSKSSLRFTPRDGFAPDTAYKVTLRSVQTSQGKISAKDGEFVRAFHTPSLKLLRADLFKIDTKRRRAEIDLVFSAPVDVSSVRARSTFTIGGNIIGRVSFYRQAQRNVVRATISDAQIDHRVALDYTLTKGAQALVDPRAKAASGAAKIQAPEGKPIKIFTASAKEGSGGFYIHVVCSDEATKERPRYYWDSSSRRSYYVTRRCVLDESDAKDSLHFSPPVQFSISPTRGGFRILGDFKRGSYALKIDRDARSTAGGVLKSTFATSFSVPARSPKLSFSAQGRYLPQRAWRKLAIRHQNLAQVELSVRHIPPENLVFWMGSGSEGAHERNSNLIFKKKIKLQSPPDTMKTSWVDVGAMLPDAPRGVLQLELRSGTTRAKSRLLLTDLNLITKREKSSGDVHVWTVGIHDNAPVSGVNVKQVVRSGRSVSSCKTGWSGHCVLKGLQKNALDKSTPFAIIAQSGRDLTYLRFDELRTPIEEAKVHGRPFSLDSAYTAALYLDRGVYRPGETARLAVVVRDAKGTAPAKGMPVTMELIDPKRKVAQRQRLQTNGAGMIATDLKFASFADTGVYRARIKAGKKSIGELSFNVEEFVPERMKVTAKLKQSNLHVSDLANVSVQARYLFGGSAQGSRTEVRCSLLPVAFKPAANKDFEYSVWRERAPSPLELGNTTGALGPDGATELACPSLSSRGTREGASRLTTAVAVFEAGSGRTTQSSASAMVHPERFYIGLKSNAESASSGDTVKLQGLIVDWEGQPTSATAKLDLTVYRVERENDWIYDEAQNRWNHRRYQRLAKDAGRQVAVSNGRFTVDLPITSNASGYVISARAGKARTDLYLQGGGSWWWWDWNTSGQDVTPRPMKPTALQLTAPKETTVGAQNKVKLRSPFKGRALFTVETDRVLHHEWVDVNKGEIDWPFTVPSFSPNVYVSALVIKDPHADSKESFLPSRAFGVRSVRVQPKPFMSKLSLVAPKTVRSSSTLKVQLSVTGLDGKPTGEKTFVTVAAVDEGILQLTRFKSPDPLRAIFDRRALGVSTHETVGWNLLLPSGDLGRSTGGDAAGNNPGRVQPIKPVALWSGLLEVPADGRLTVPFEVPQYRGALRVMAVAAGAKRIASAQTTVTVRDPLTLQTTLPRFLTLGDQVEVPVFVTNLSGKKQNIKISLSAEPLVVKGVGSSKEPVLKIIGGAQRALNLNDQQSEKRVFKIEALRAVGAAKLKVQVTGAGHTSEETLEVPFHPAAPESTRVQRIEITKLPKNAKGRIDLKPFLQGWLPTTERSTFWVTNNPYGDTFDHLKYLLRYPYGCIEQTTSSTRPLLFLGRFMGNVDPKLISPDRIEARVLYGVERVFSMQTPAGGFGYWPGASEPTAWGTAYAVHMLLDAQKLKYPVSNERLQDALQWMERELNKNKKTSYWRDAEAYMHYVLALAKKGRKARMLKLIDKIKGETAKRRQAREDLYLLKAGLYHMGDHRFEKDLKRPDTSPIERKRYNGWSFYSDRRARGLMLSTFADLFGSVPEGEPLANLVASALRGKRSGWYTTQELVWGITGLGKFVGQVSEGHRPAKLFADDQSIAPLSKTNKAKSRTWTLYRASEFGSLELELKSQKDDRLFLILSSEGIQKDAKYEYGGQGLSLTRTYRVASGEPAKLGALALGEVVYVELKLKNTSQERVQNLAMVDRLPAGFEIENPRLGRGSSVSWLKRNTQWRPDHMNIRDDRVEIFGALQRGEVKTVVYAVRAISAGRYMIPPAQLEAMYDPDRWARVAGGEVVIGGQ